jgi:hypothetical protein
MSSDAGVRFTSEDPGPEVSRAPPGRSARDIEAEEEQAEAERQEQFDRALREAREGRADADPYLALLANPEKVRSEAADQVADIAHGGGAHHRDDVRFDEVDLKCDRLGTALAAR